MSPEEQRSGEALGRGRVAARAPRTVGGVVYLGMLFTVLVGVCIAFLGQWQSGLTIVGGAFVAGAAARLVLPETSAGMLRVRRKVSDVATLTVLGLGLIVVVSWLATVRP